MVLRNHLFTSPWLLQIRLSTFNPKSLPFSFSRPASASLLPPSISFKLHSESPSLSICAGNVEMVEAMCRDSRLVPGAAATEIELVQRLKEYVNAETGLDKYAISKYAESFKFLISISFRILVCKLITIGNDLYVQLVV
ncbi:unnamed protein product [Brassica napus]|uniref:(rape) hypothetical protein n=1 Tax=Brassica napus TaxID=3708 RepID=A0A817AQV6_BRANA|nr:unnamed protein product [Brassica napus]